MEYRQKLGNVDATLSSTDKLLKKNCQMKKKLYLCSVKKTSQKQKKMKHYEQNGYPPPVKVCITSSYADLGDLFFSVYNLVSERQTEQQKAEKPLEATVYLPYHVMQDMIDQLWLMVSSNLNNLDNEETLSNLRDLIRLIRLMYNFERYYYETRIALLRDLPETSKSTIAKGGDQ